MNVLRFDHLLHWILKEYQTHQTIFGIHQSLFYHPRKDAPYRFDGLYGSSLQTPIGPAAGPHTQLAQNIISAWLTGGRFIELKTVQIMDELEIPRPCIDMADEGYNVEWSQELKLEQSLREYIHAWVIIHILHRFLHFDTAGPVGTIFNMSVGYNLEGIQQPAMLRFMRTLENAEEEIDSIRQILIASFPQFSDIEVPVRISNNVTLSTMHGCPPDEIQKIAQYLIMDRGLHTTIKLNPTLLGRERVLEILHGKLGYTDVCIPESVFQKDLHYSRAMTLIRSLKETAAEQGVRFGVKLSNTLAVRNHRNALPGEEMYMSGRALFPVTINLYHRLLTDCDGDLNVSFSAGADAWNTADIIASGAWPVTVASDLLKPGGYCRLNQYLENLEAAMQRAGASDLIAFSTNKMQTLENLAAESLREPRYQKAFHLSELPKVPTGLELFDCITAPCVEQCAVKQDIPEYAWHITHQAFDDAMETILSRNPLPGVTGYVCTHLCQNRCTRNNYDQPVAIRMLKRFAAEHGRSKIPDYPKNRHRVAIIGAGPAGLSAAYFLTLNGCQCTIFEAKDQPGGMLAIAPAFRLPTDVVQKDIDRIINMGVQIETNHPICCQPEELLQNGYEAVFIGCGFSQDARLNIPGDTGSGVIPALTLLEQTAYGTPPELGSRIFVIGGGNTAMDAARTAQRLTGKPVTVLYRRSRQEMPAEPEEIADLLLEGNDLMELVAPEQILLTNGRVTSIVCSRNRLSEPGTDGRKTPIRIEGSEFTLEADTIIVAIGQKPDPVFFQGSSIMQDRSGAILVNAKTGETMHQCIYAGGDATRGPAIIIQACADGMRAAEAICERFGVGFKRRNIPKPTLTNQDILDLKRIRARKEYQQSPTMRPIDQRQNFDLIEQTLSLDAAIAESRRCVQCSTICDKCVEVCPNRANYSCHIHPISLTLPIIAIRNGHMEHTGNEIFQVTQERQIIHIDDFCNACGNCQTFCVHEGRPYLDKPRLFLTRDGFFREQDHAFFIDGDTILQRENGKESQLIIKADGMTYSDDCLTIDMTVEGEIRHMALKNHFEGYFSLKGAFEMMVIYQGARKELPFLVWQSRL